MFAGPAYGVIHLHFRALFCGVADVFVIAATTWGSRQFQRAQAPVVDRHINRHDNGRVINHGRRVLSITAG
jgi:hypothetical protein